MTTLSVQSLLRFAVEQGASDLHLSSGDSPMLRLSGDLVRVDLPPLGEEEAHRLIFQVMSDQQRRTFQEHQEVDFAFALDEVLRFRVNVFVHNRGEGAVFRLIPNKIPRLEDLGLPPVLRALSDAEKGLVLVTGPTGSGKSTTLAAMINYINGRLAGHILTLEDPIEFIHPPRRCLISQREVGSQTKSFQAALRSALREDPDVILVGELRDLETTSLALTAPARDVARSPGAASDHEPAGTKGAPRRRARQIPPADARGGRHCGGHCTPVDARRAAADALRARCANGARRRSAPNRRRPAEPSLAG